MTKFPPKPVYGPIYWTRLIDDTIKRFPVIMAALAKAERSDRQQVMSESEMERNIA